MESEKIAAIVIALMVAGILSGYLALQHWEDISDNLTEKALEIDNNDLVDIHYILKNADDGTVLSTSFDFADNMTGGEVYRFFINTNRSVSPPEEYNEYSNLIENYFVEEFIEGVKGLTVGDSKVIGPLSEEEAFGRAPAVGDIIDFNDPSIGEIMITNIEKDYPMPDDYIDYYGDINTSLFEIRQLIYDLGDNLTIYRSWPDSATITKINETMIWFYITPPDNKKENITWVDINLGIEYPANATSVISMNESAIVLKHNVSKGDIINVPDYSAQQYMEFEIISFNETKINASYTVEDQTYTETFDRIVKVDRNQTLSIIFTIIREELEAIINQYKTFYGLEIDVPFSFHPFAGEKVELYVEIVDIQKN